MSTPDLRYPIGPSPQGTTVTPQNRQAILLEIAELPDRLRDAVQDLSESQLNEPYRPEGWSVRQVVHHLADSHIHWYIRTRTALTEHEPAPKSYDEKLWAELKDARSGPLEPSLLILEGLHGRIVPLLESLTPEEWAREFVHPHWGRVAVEALVPVYAWHGRHHTAHIMELRKRMGW